MGYISKSYFELSNINTCLKILKNVLIIGILIKGLDKDYSYILCTLFFTFFFPVYLQYTLTSIRQLFHSILVSNVPHTYILFLSLCSSLFLRIILLLI